MKTNTLDDFEVEGKTVLVRVDINSPLDPETKEITDINRIKEISDTIVELSENNAKVVVLAHQGRPAGDDFITLEKHADKMSEVLGIPVKYVDDIFGSTARREISELRPGEILLLENVRFYSEEIIDIPAEEQAKTHLVQKLSPLADLYVNDAFAAAHRSQASLVGFGITIPTAAGRLMEREIEGLKKARNPTHPSVYVLGGAKVDDALNLIKNIISDGIADKILTGGLLANVFLAGDGHELGETNSEILSKKGYREEFSKAKRLLDKYEDKIEIPVDLRVENKDGEEELVEVENLPTENPIYDIGDKTVDRYSDIIINEAGTIFGKGPQGLFEKPPFDTGTNGINRAIAQSDAYTTIGGGHLVASARKLGITDKIDHISTGGGACLTFLSGKKLPVLDVLEKAAD